VKTPTDHFVYGVIAAAASAAAMQDWMGLDAYVEHVKNNWIHLPWTFDILIFIIAVALHFYYSRKNESK
jgi:hypothetical protein